MPRPNRWLLAAFFLSGAAALIFEVLWTRMLGWIFGTTIHAISTSVTAFMAGLALGSWLGGRLADRFADSLRLYVLLELLTGGLGMILTLALPHLGPVAALLDPLGLTGRFCFIFAILLIPTTMMGATLPILVRHLSRLDARLGSITARLYAINTVGAVAGTLATDFALVPALGLAATGLLAGGFNLLAATVVAGLRRHLGCLSQSAGESRDLPAPVWLAAAFACSGFAALAYEVLWTRVLLFLVGSEIYAFSLILAVFLAGLAGGAALMGPQVDQHPRPLRVLAGLQVLLALLGIVTVLAGAHFEDLKPVWSHLGQGWAGYVLTTSAACIIVMLPATLAMGATVPLFVRLGAREGAVGKAVGTMYAANTVGSALGSLAAGFLLLPALGLQHSLSLIASLNLVLALMLFWASRPAPVYRVAAILLVAGSSAGAFSLPPDLLLTHTYERRFGTLVYFREGLESTLAVATPEDFDGQRYRRLVVNGYSMTGLSFKSQRYMKLLGHLPVLLHRDPREALVICLGTGMTLSAVAAHPDLERIDCVDLDPGVREALPYFASANKEVWKDPRVSIHIEDGRHWLLTTGKRYDVITFEPPPPHNAGVVNLYSRDYYELCRSRLKPGGLVCQWLPVHQMTPEEVRQCIRAFVDVFPSGTLWSNFAYSDLCLLGGEEPLHLDPSVLGPRMAKISPELKAIGLEDAESLLATFLHGPDALRGYTKSSLALTDDRPFLQYSIPTQVRVDLDWLLAKREHVEKYLAGPARKRGLQRAYRLHDCIYQLYIFELLQPRAVWKRELLADSISPVDRDNPYAQYAFRVTDGVRALLDRRVASGHAPSLLWRARWFRWRGRNQEAREDLKAFLAREPDSALGWYLLGRLGPREAAAGCFKRALANCSDPELRLELQRAAGASAR
ncbi:MAG: fused MFS/spermidine synthase [Armatimonadetes bacterium]|nr:fused MFS/spermidine synthase [Armatimonadota bacterium]